MTRRVVNLIVALALLGLGATHPVRASAAPLLPHKPPGTLYPAGVRIAVTDPLSNFQKSCLWDLDCADGATPVTHSRDEDALGRLGGWLVFAEWDGPHRRQMTFTLFGSSYDTPAHAQAAAADYQTQITGHRWRLTAFPCPPSSAGPYTSQYCARYHDHSAIGGHYFSLSMTEGALEIELLSYANTRFHALRRFTFAQARAAMAPPAETPASGRMYAGRFLSFRGAVSLLREMRRACTG